MRTACYTKQLVIILSEKVCLLSKDTLFSLDLSSRFFRHSLLFSSFIRLLHWFNMFISRHWNNLAGTVLFVYYILSIMWKKNPLLHSFWNLSMDEPGFDIDLFYVKIDRKKSFTTLTPWILDSTMWCWSKFSSICPSETQPGNCGLA